MRASLTTGCTLVLVAGLLTGCGAVNELGGERGGWSSEDVAGVSGAMASDSAVVEDGLFEGEDATQAAASFNAGVESGEGTSELIRPLRFWRRISRVERHFEFAFSDTDSTGRPATALVTLRKDLFGTFNILNADSMHTLPPDSLRDQFVIHKPLADQWTRRVLLKRVAKPDSMRTDRGEGWMWKVVASTAVQVTSEIPEVPATRIVSIRIQSGDRDTTLSDPTALIWRHHLPLVDPGAQVTITVTTERPDDVVALMHRDQRFFLRPNGDNTYTGVWTAPLELVLRHVGINALSHGTVFDDTAPYSSQAWMWPYAIRGTATAAGTP